MIMSLLLSNASGDLRTSWASTERCVDSSSGSSVDRESAMS